MEAHHHDAEDKALRGSQRGTLFDSEDNQGNAKICGRMLSTLSGVVKVITWKRWDRRNRARISAPDRAELVAYPDTIKRETWRSE